MWIGAVERSRSPWPFVNVTFFYYNKVGLSISHHISPIPHKYTRIIISTTIIVNTPLFLFISSPLILFPSTINSITFFQGKFIHLPIPPFRVLCLPYHHHITYSAFFTAPGRHAAGVAAGMGAQVLDGAVVESGGMTITSFASFAPAG